MNALRLTTITTLVGVLMGGVFAIPARAHGGELVYSGQVGPYYVEVTDRVLETGEGLLYTLTIRNSATGLPVDGADVSITAQFDDRAVALRRPQYFGNQYQVVIADDGANIVEVTATIDAPPGTASFRHEIAGSGVGSNWLLGIALAAAGLLAVGFELRRRRVHRATGSPSCESGPAGIEAT